MGYKAAMISATVVCNFSSVPNKGDTCSSFASSWGQTLANFQALNISISCSTLTAGQSCCVVGTVKDEPATTTSTITTTALTTTTSTSQYDPTQSGIPPSCDGFHLIASGDQCDTIEAKYGITEAQFKAWNPSIDSSCSNLWLDYYVCVQIPGATTTTSTPQPTSTGPWPQMPGVASNCKPFYKVKTDDNC